MIVINFLNFREFWKVKLTYCLKKLDPGINWIRLVNSLKIHIVGRSAREYLEKLKNSSLIESLAKLKQEDPEVLALAILASRKVSDNVYLVTTDRDILDVASNLEITNLKPLTPKKFKSFINNI